VFHSLDLLTGESKETWVQFKSETRTRINAGPILLWTKCSLIMEGVSSGSFITYLQR